MLFISCHVPVSRITSVALTKERHWSCRGSVLRSAGHNKKNSACVQDSGSTCDTFLQTIFLQSVASYAHMRRAVASSDHHFLAFSFTEWASSPSLLGPGTARFWLLAGAAALVSELAGVLAE